MFYIEVDNFLANRIKLEHSYAAVSYYGVEIKQENPVEVSALSHYEAKIKQENPVEVSLEDINSINTEIDLGVVMKTEPSSADCSQLTPYCDLPSGSQHPTIIYVSGIGAGRQKNTFVPTDLKSNSASSQPHLGINNVYDVTLPRHYKLHLKHLKDLNAKLKNRACIAEKKCKETKQQVTKLRKSVLKLENELTILKRKEKESHRHIKTRQDLDKKHAQKLKSRELMLIMKQNELRDARSRIKQLQQLVSAERHHNLKYSEQMFVKLQIQKADLEKASVKLKHSLDFTRSCLVKEVKECKSHKNRTSWLAARLKLREKEIAHKDAMIKKNVEAFTTKVCQYCGF